MSARKSASEGVKGVLQASNQRIVLSTEDSRRRQEREGRKRRIFVLGIVSRCTGMERGSGFMVWLRRRGARKAGKYEYGMKTTTKCTGRTARMYVRRPWNAPKWAGSLCSRQIKSLADLADDSREDLDAESTREVERVNGVGDGALSRPRDFVSGPEWVKVAREVLTRCQKHAKARPFMEPVDPETEGLDDYFQIIEDPMDFSTIANRLNKVLLCPSLSTVFSKGRLSRCDCRMRRSHHVNFVLPVSHSSLTDVT